MQLTSILALLAAGAAKFADAAPSSSHDGRSALEPYQPYSVSCPSGPIVRPATGLNSDEALYISKRRPLADAALQQWLQKTWGSNVTLSSSDLPAVALVLGGGGPKAGLLAAGVIQALDSRDSSTGVSGLLQSMTYMSALSGGSLAFSGVIGNNFEKISTLQSSLYNTTYQHLLTVPLENIAQITADLAAKAASGLPVTLIDVYGRIIGYDFIGGSEGANGVTMSSVASTSAFTSGELPYPIIQTTNAALTHGECYPVANDSLWEFGPYEFGSWNTAVGAFIPSKYLGSKLTAGQTTWPGRCQTDFDNLGFITGMSANIIAQNKPDCAASISTKLGLPSSNSTLEAALLNILASVEPLQDLTTSLSFGIVPNPFYKYPKSVGVNADPDLFMLDGGVSGQGMPIWPWLQPERTVDVIITSDHSSDASNNITTGSALYATYVQAQSQGLARMPLVPTQDQIAADNLTSHARFFGCNQPSAATLIWLPDVNTTHYDSSEFSFSPAEIDDLILLGNEMSTQTGAPEWPVCLACAIMMKKISGLPAACSACFDKYCWTG